MSQTRSGTHAKSRAAEASLLAVTLVWGTSFTIVKSALADASALVFVGARFSIAALVLALVWRRQLRQAARSHAARHGGVIAGAVLALAMALQTAGLLYTSPSKSAFLTALNVVMVPLLGACVYQSVPRMGEILGVTMAFLGTGLLTWPDGAAQFNAGDILTIGCAAAFAVHILVTGHWAVRAGAIPLSLWQAAVAAVACLAAAPLVETPFVRPGWRLAGALALTSLLCTALAYSVQAWAQQYTTATRAALIFALEPVSAAFTSWAATGEVLPGRGLAGAGMILGGVLWAELKPARADLHP